MVYNIFREVIAVDKSQFINSLVKKPDILGFERYLFISPHPDDSELDCGGTMRKLSNLGKEVYLAVVTDGRKGYSGLDDVTEEDVARIRQNEQLQAGKILGIKEVFFLDFEDLGDYSMEQVRDKIVQLIRTVKPDIVFTVDPYVKYEVHPDHIKAGMAALQAVLFSKFSSIMPEFSPHDVKAAVLYFTPSTNTYVCVEDTYDKKLEALSQHKSQFGQLWEMLKYYLSEKAKMYGKEIGCEKAEGFKVIPGLLLHAIPEVEYY